MPKKFTQDEIVHIVDDNFIKYYEMMTLSDKLTISERLFFDSIREFIVNGVGYDLDNQKGD